MALLRRLCRIAALIVWAAVVAALSAPYRIRGGWKNIKEISRFTRLWSKGIAKIVNLRVTTSGALPRDPGLLVSNHVSYLDIIAHGSVLPLRYSPKSEIKKWPVLGWYIGLSRPIWTNRRSKQTSKKILRDFVKTVRRGMYLIVYPEGTSTDGTNGILPFKSTSFEASIIGQMPILPVLTRYKKAPGQPAVCWYGDMTLLPHIWRVLGISSIEAELHFLKPIYPEGKTRKELAAFVHSVMAREYRRMDQSVVRG
ncbi:MAG: 1-acyl-sn-glycerol-3-phosphate acyltransferase [Candidatus Omnitrophota bacterium]